VSFNFPFFCFYLKKKKFWQGQGAIQIWPITTKNKKLKIKKLKKKPVKTPPIEVFAEK